MSLFFFFKQTIEPHKLYCNIFRYYHFFCHRWQFLICTPSNNLIDFLCVLKHGKLPEDWNCDCSWKISLFVQEKKIIFKKMYLYQLVASDIWFRFECEVSNDLYNAIGHKCDRWLWKEKQSCRTKMSNWSAFTHSKSNFTSKQLIAQTNNYFIIVIWKRWWRWWWWWVALLFVSISSCLFYRCWYCLTCNKLQVFL